MLDNQHIMSKPNQFQLNPDGSVERVGPFGSYGPVVEASTKTEATAKFLSFAYRAAENTPTVKVRNGAYQLAYESLSYGITVEAGREGRHGAICLSGVANRNDLTDNVAAFDYYASAEYVNNQ